MLNIRMFHQSSWDIFTDFRKCSVSSQNLDVVGIFNSCAYKTNKNLSVA